MNPANDAIDDFFGNLANIKLKVFINKRNKRIFKERLPNQYAELLAKVEGRSLTHVAIRALISPGALRLAADPKTEYAYAVLLAKAAEGELSADEITALTSPGALRLAADHKARYLKLVKVEDDCTLAKILLETTDAALRFKERRADLGNMLRCWQGLGLQKKIYADYIPTVMKSTVTKNGFKELFYWQMKNQMVAKENKRLKSL